MLATVSAAARAADTPPARPQIGEVRMLAIAPDGRDAVATLHRDGWLEARGQLLSIRAYPELFKAIGRTWTSDGVAEGRFAVPDVHDWARRPSSANAFGVLGPGDLVSGGRVEKGWERPYPLSSWIFAGRQVSQAGDAGIVSR